MKAKNEKVKLSYDGITIEFGQMIWTVGRKRTET